MAGASQDQYSEMDHTRGKELVAKEIYYTLLDKAEDFGEMKINARKHHIEWLVNDQKFAAVYIKKTYVLLEIELDYPIPSSRVSRVDRTARLNYQHVIKLTEVELIDKQIVNWLNEAYDFKRTQEKRNPNSFYHG